MTQILTPEEKKYLRFVTRYLQSFGMKEGNISIEIDYDLAIGFMEGKEKLISYTIIKTDDQYQLEKKNLVKSHNFTSHFDIIVYFFCDFTL